MAANDASAIRKNYKNIADAIRGKTGSQEGLTPNEMPAEIASIETGITPTGSLNIDENGEYDVTEKAGVNVQVPNPVDDFNVGDLTTVVDNGGNKELEKLNLNRGLYEYSPDGIDPFRTPYYGWVANDPDNMGRGLDPSSGYLYDLGGYEYGSIYLENGLTNGETYTFTGNSSRGLLSGTLAEYTPPVVPTVDSEGFYYYNDSTESFTNLNPDEAEYGWNGVSQATTDAYRRLHPFEPVGYAYYRFNGYGTYGVTVPYDGFQDGHVYWFFGSHNQDPYQDLNLTNYDQEEGFMQDLGLSMPSGWYYADNNDPTSWDCSIQFYTGPSSDGLYRLVGSTFTAVSDPSGTYNIGSNGTYNIAQYASVAVAVPDPTASLTTNNIYKYNGNAQFAAQSDNDLFEYLLNGEEKYVWINVDQDSNRYYHTETMPQNTWMSLGGSGSISLLSETLSSGSIYSYDGTDFSSPSDSDLISALYLNSGSCYYCDGSYLSICNIEDYHFYYYSNGSFTDLGMDGLETLYYGGGSHFGGNQLPAINLNNDTIYKYEGGSSFTEVFFGSRGYHFFDDSTNTLDPNLANLSDMAEQLGLIEDSYYYYDGSNMVSKSNLDLADDMASAGVGYYYYAGSDYVFESANLSEDTVYYYHADDSYADTQYSLDSCEVESNHFYCYEGNGSFAELETNSAQAAEALFGDGLHGSELKLVYWNAGSHAYYVEQIWDANEQPLDVGDEVTIEIGYAGTYKITKVAD